MDEQTRKVNFLDVKSAIPEPFKWVVVFNIGIVGRKEYEEIGYAGATPVQMIGFNRDLAFPTDRVTGEKLEEIKTALLDSIDKFFCQAAEQDAKIAQENGLKK